MSATYVDNDAAFEDPALVEEDFILEEGPSFEWGAVLAGGLIAAGTTFFLVIVGAAIGLSLAGTRNLSGAHSFLTIGAIYFLAAQAFGFALGGYVTGRLMRPAPETDDEHFRTDAHGLALWSLAIVIGLAFLGLAGAAGIDRAAPAATQPMAYWADKLLTGAPEADYDARNAQVARLLTADTATGAGSDTHNQLVALVAAQNRMEAQDAAAQVQSVESDIRADANAARKALLYLTLWTAFALLFGGFIAVASTVMARFHEEDFSPRHFRFGRK